MDVLEAIATRRSVRKFAGTAVEDELLAKVFEAVRQSPSWANMQCWRFVVLRDAAVKDRVAELSYLESFFAPKGYKVNPAMRALREAPVVVVICADPAESGEIRGQDYYLTDTGIAAQTLMLAAWSLGLGTVYVGVYDEDKLRELLGIPASIRIVGLMPLGYPLDAVHKKGPGRKPLEDLVFSEKWIG